MTNYDDEFGPNKLPTCPTCKTRLEEDQVCWCAEESKFKQEKPE